MTKVRPPRSTAITQQPTDLVFSGHLFMMPVAAVIARVLGVPLWAQVHGTEGWGEVSGQWNRRRSHVGSDRPPHAVEEKLSGRSLSSSGKNAGCKWCKEVD
jgi:hypothetical protein